MKLIYRLTESDFVSSSKGTKKATSAMDLDCLKHGDFPAFTEIRSVLNIPKYALATKDFVRNRKVLKYFFTLARVARTFPGPFRANSRTFCIK